MDVDEAALAQAADEVERRSSLSPTVKSSSNEPRAFPGTGKFEQRRQEALARLAASRAAKAKAAAPVQAVGSSSSGKKIVTALKQRAAPIELSSD